MQVVVLASGSKGNAALVEMDGTKLLIDAGISATRIKKALALRGLAPEELSGILVTHEHRDHIAGLTTLSKWYHLPIFGRRDTLAALSCAVKVPEQLLHPVEAAFPLDGVKVEGFSTSHDAADPTGWRITGSERFVLATDLGFVTSSVQEALEGADILMLEANYDQGMLEKGPYPWHLKRRIMSNRGHLSNSDAAWALARLKRRPGQVILAHLSEENNRPGIAEETVRKILHRQGMEVPLAVASQTEPLALATDSYMYQCS
ncbi:MAG: MBL fold metallo-hydrolase [Selenomonas ruminantium]|nr:MBL fold metallo-hydrolase [Selenomonas ruminantium]